MGASNEKHDYYITINGETFTLNKTVLEKDLGVFIDPDLSFNEHITTKVNKANSMCGLLMRTHDRSKWPSVPGSLERYGKPRCKFF